MLRSNHLPSLTRRAGGKITEPNVVHAAVTKAANNSARVRMLRLHHTLHGPPTLATLTRPQVLTCNTIGAHTPMKIIPVNFI